MTGAPPLQLLLGAAGHGVVDYAADVASELSALDDRTVAVAVPDIADAIVIARGAQRSHLHVTDRLLGSSPENAALNLERLAAVTRLTITVHDVPQTSDGTVLARRVDAYTRFLTAADAVVVNSRHEQQLVAEFLPGAARPHVIPLGARVSATPRHPGIGASRTAGASGLRDLTVLVAGYVYPGKGHAEAIRSAAEAAEVLRAAGEPVGAVVVRALGGPSAGHEVEVDRMTLDAERQGVRLEVTGFLVQEDFAASLSDDGIPLAAHQHVSASRSMLDWVEAGRRPLVAASRYAVEMAALRPETITLYDPSGLTRNLAEAWLVPARTWLEPRIPLAPTLRDAAVHYRAWWDQVAAE